MAPPDDRPPEDGIEAFLGQSTRDLEDWHWLWSGDHAFPVETHRGATGRLVVAFKKLLRPVVKPPLNDLWDRQRVFNMILVEHLLQRDRRVEEELRLQREELTRLREALDKLEGFRLDGVRDMVRHSDALFALLDQKLDRYRRESDELTRRLRSAGDDRGDSES